MPPAIATTAIATTAVSTAPHRRYRWHDGARTLVVAFSDSGGSGPAWLLLPALSTVSSRREWEPFCQAVADSPAPPGGRPRLIRLDWPGFGESDRLKLPYDAELLARFLWQVDGLPAMTAVDPNNGWIANVTSGPTQSGWIAPNPQGQQGANYTYSLDFFIPAGATGLSLSGQWATDDSARLFLNGQEILSARTDASTTDPWTVFQSFATDSTARFLPGTTNQLRAEIVNTGGPTGIQAQFNGSYSPAAVPGPLPVLGVAAAFRGSRRLRKRLRPHSS